MSEELNNQDLSENTSENKEETTPSTEEATSEESVEETTPPAEESATEEPAEETPAADEETSDESDEPEEKPVGLNKSMFKEASSQEKDVVEKYNSGNEKDNTELFKKITVGVVSLIILIFLVVGINAIRNKAALNRKMAKLSQVSILAEDKVVFEDSFRLTIKTSPLVDLTVMLLKNKRYEGKLVAENGEGVKYWEFTVMKLRPGSYDYKCFAKNTETDKYVQISGKFKVE